MISHGISLLAVLVGGFGLIVKTGMSGSWPGWIYGKLLVWVLLGGAVVFNKRVNLPWITKALLLVTLGGVESI